MELGMLWFDGDTQRPLQERLERAARYYSQKYGRRANTCYLHPSTIEPSGNRSDRKSGRRVELVAGMVVRSSRTVLPNHFWLGVEESEGPIPLPASLGALERQRQAVPR
ncbi:MAG: hypothetical protein ABSG98_04110 [Anaerolineales bacterium]|jgi:hypothetical protein